MSVNPQILARGTSFTQNIEPVVREHLAMIDRKLTEAGRKIGWNVVAVDIEAAFTTLRSLPQNDAQALVYSGIISSLEQRGFAVRTIIVQTKATFLIGYEIGLPQAQIDNLYRVVKKSRLPDKEAIEKFRAGDIRGRITSEGVSEPVVPRAARPLGETESKGGGRRRRHKKSPESPRMHRPRPQSPPAVAPFAAVPQELPDGSDASSSTASETDAS